MRHSKLSEHAFKKGEFITPLNSVPAMQELSDEKSWTYGRMPEYLWIGLILEHFGRDDGLNKLFGIISELHKLAPKLCTVRISQILELENSVQRKFYNCINIIASKETLSPLTVILTASKAPIFAECFYCYN